MILHFSNDIKGDSILITNIVNALKNIKKLVELTIINLEYYCLFINLITLKMISFISYI